MQVIWVKLSAFSKSEINAKLDINSKPESNREINIYQHPSMPAPKEVTDIKIILQKMEHYCAYQERSEQEVKKKLATFKIPESQKKQILAELKLLGFLDDARYARAFTMGKFRINKWGRNKIRYALRQKGISNNIIEKAFEEIEEGVYLLTMENLAKTKLKSVRYDDKFQTISKVVNFLISKGYETSLSWDCVKKLTNS